MKIEPNRNCLNDDDYDNNSNDNDQVGYSSSLLRINPHKCSSSLKLY